MSWRLIAAIALSVLVHLVLLWYWRIPQPEPVTVSVLELELVAAPTPEPPPLVEPEPLPEPEPEPDPEPALAETESVEPVEPEDEPSPLSPPVAESRPRTVLNLNPPANWDALVAPEEPSRVRSGLEFNPRLSDAVTQRIQDRSRERLLTTRERALYGLPEDVYGRSGPMGDVVKVDGACFSLEQTPELGAEPRWWMVPCREVKANPFEMKPLETDARGRVVSD